MTSKDLHDIDKDLAVLQKEVDTQFKEVFTSVIWKENSVIYGAYVGYGA